MTHERSTVKCRHMARSKLSIDYRVFVFFLLLSTLSAYNFYSIPFTWIAAFGVVSITTFIIFSKGRLIRLPFTLPLYLWLLWAAVITLIGVYVYGGGVVMPPLSTTPYYLFVLLRLMAVVSCVSMIYLVYWLCRCGYKREVLNSLYILGVLVSCYAIYAYFAQIFGLPELPRNRLSTSGESSQKTHFTYAFHRAMGSFREPSHLAQWLLIPLFITFARVKSQANLITYISLIIVITALLLTGSLTGISSSILGFCIALIVSKEVFKSSIINLIRLIFVLGLSVFVFSAIAAPNQGGGIDLHNIIWNRMSPIIFSGDALAASNRSHVYEYVDYQKSIQYIGFGLGNANLDLTYYRGIDAIGSFLSLYLNVYFSTGLIGLIIFIIAILFPVYKLWRVQSKKMTNDAFWFLTAYLSYLISYLGNLEELSIMFGLAFGILIYEIDLLTRNLIITNHLNQTLPEESILSRV